MNRDRIEGNWKQFKGKVKVQWGILSNDQLDVIAGEREQLAGRIQEKNGMNREATEKQTSEWREIHKAMKHLALHPKRLPLQLK